MAVIIENMNMPKRCLDCPFYHHNAPFEIPYCQFGGYVKYPYVKEEFCPLKEYRDPTVWDRPENCY